MTDPKCSQCERPVYGRGTLCLEHLYMEAQIASAQYAQAAAQLNVIQQYLAQAFPWLGSRPRLEFPPPLPPPSGDSIGTQINVDRSSVGAINTGAVENLQASVRVLHESGQENLADAIASFAAAIMCDASLPSAERDEVVEHLGFVADSIATEPAKRRPNVLRSSLTAIGDIAERAADAVTLWPPLRAALIAALDLADKV